jgi:hypothetical protein
MAGPSPPRSASAGLRRSGGEYLYLVDVFDMASYAARGMSAVIVPSAGYAPVVVGLALSSRAAALPVRGHCVGMRSP